MHVDPFTFETRPTPKEIARVGLDPEQIEKQIEQVCLFFLYLLRDCMVMEGTEAGRGGGGGGRGGGGRGGGGAERGDG